MHVVIVCSIIFGKQYGTFVAIKEPCALLPFEQNIAVPVYFAIENSELEEIHTNLTMAAKKEKTAAAVEGEAEGGRDQLTMGDEKSFEGYEVCRERPSWWNIQYYRICVHVGQAR